MATVRVGGRLYAIGGYGGGKVVEVFNPPFYDSDHDGLADDEELESYGTDPLIADTNIDTDGDGLMNAEEVLTYGTDPLVADSDLDSDGDGLTNVEEIDKVGTDPLNVDTDSDYFSDKLDPLPFINNFYIIIPSIIIVVGSIPVKWGENRLRLMRAILTEVNKREFFSLEGIRYFLSLESTKLRKITHMLLKKSILSNFIHKLLKMKQIDYVYFSDIDAYGSRWLVNDFQSKHKFKIASKYSRRVISPEEDLAKATCTCRASDQELRQRLRPYWPGFNLCRNCRKPFVKDSREPELPYAAPTPKDVIEYAYCLCGAKTKPSYRFCKICGRPIHMEPPPWWLKATWILMGID